MNSSVVCPFSRSLSLAVFSLAMSATAADLTVDGNIFATGTLDINGNTASFGTSGANPGYSVIYTDGNPASVDFSASTAGVNWTWRQGTINQQLKISSTNTLSLFPVGGSVPGVFLDPNGNAVYTTFTGNGVTKEFIKLSTAGANAAGSTQRIAGYTDVLQGYVDFKRFASGGPTTGLVLGTFGGDVLTIRSSGSGDPGKVGIGTDSPSAKLDVVGDVKVSGSVTVGGVPVLTNTGSGGGLTGLNASQLISGTVPIAVLPSSVVQTTGNQTLTGKTLDGATLTGTTHFSGGNVGIGTGTPANKLDVSGNASIGGSKTLSDTYQVSPWSAMNSLIVSGADAANGFGGIYAGSNDAEAAGQTLGSFGFLQKVSGKLGTANAGLKASIGAVSVGGGGTTGGFGADMLFYTRQDNSTSNPSERLRITAGGKVGIGTSAPSDKVSIIGDFSSTLGLYTGTGYGPSLDLHGNSGTAGGRWHRLISTGASDPMGANKFIIDDLGYGTRFTIDSVGNIGVGTTTPTEKLEVAGNLKVTGNIITPNGTLALPAASTGTLLTTSATQTISGVNTFTGNTVLAATILGGTTAATQMKVDSAGNVGVGTSTPSAKLNVVGTSGFLGQSWFTNGSNISGYSWMNAAITTDSIEIVNNNGTVNTSSPTLGFHRYGSGGPQFRLGPTGDKVLYLESANPGSARNPNPYGGGANSSFDRFHVDGQLTTSGSVGIGTSAPTNKLSIIQGTGTAAGLGLYTNTGYGPSLEIRADSGTANGKWFRIISTGASDAIGANKLIVVDQTAGSAIRLTIDGAGKLGIGTDAPAEKLDVVGNAKISGTLTVNNSPVATTGAGQTWGAQQIYSAGVKVTDDTTAGGLTLGGGANDGANLRLLAAAGQAQWNIDNSYGSLRFFTESAPGVDRVVAATFINKTLHFNDGRIELAGSGTYTAALEMTGSGGEVFRIRSAPRIALEPLGVNGPPHGKFNFTNGGLGINTTSTNATNIITASSALQFEANTIPSGGISFGSDVNLYRSAVSTLRTDQTLSAATVIVTSNVGIGTTAPVAKLDVAGDAQVRGKLRIAPSGDLSMGTFKVGTNPAN